MLALALALLLDRFVGDPDWLWRRVPHPVVWIGWLIEQADRMRLRFARRPVSQMVAGGLLLAMLAALALSLHVAVGQLKAFTPVLGWGLDIAIAVVLLAQKSLADHVSSVDTALAQSLSQGRKAVAMIVGRDVSQLDETGVSAAAVESLAENASDGVIAPALWYALGGVGGIVLYKMVNTADSMIGHRTPEHEFFGKPAARLDDLLNWPAARLMALLVVVVVAFEKGCQRAANIWHQVRRDAPRHRSPNAGWPETAFAAALGIRLGGPRAYGEALVDGVWLNRKGRLALRGDIARALRLFRHCCSLLLVVFLACGVVAWFGDA